MTDQPDRPRLAALRETHRVYGPGADSRLLAEAAVERVGTDDRVLDVGTGTGYIADRIVATTGAAIVGVDIESAACRQARAAGVPVVLGDLCSGFAADAFDAVVSNPPYLPARSDGRNDAMARAIAAGPAGCAVIDRLLQTVERVLRPDGRLLILCSSETGPDAVRATAEERGFNTTRVADADHPGERLLVFECQPAGG
jgi:HemK-related putative methylase